MSYIRPAGALEKYSIYRHELQMNAPVMVLAEYPMPITRDNLYPAIKQVIADNAMLAVNLKLGKEIELFVANSIDLDLAVEFRSDLTVKGNLPSIFQHLTVDQIPYEKPHSPLWRVIVAESRYVIFLFDHGVLDGNSGRLFHTNLLEYLIAGKDDSHTESQSSTALVSSKELVEPMEIATKAGPPKLFMLKLVFSEILGKIWPTVDPYCWTGAAPFLPYKSNTGFRSISSEDASKYLNLARANGTSITGLFTAVLLATVRSSVPQDYVNPKDKSTKITYTIPIDCRGREHLEKCKNAYGNLVSAFNDEVLVTESMSNTEINELAKLIITRLRTSVESGEHKHLLGALKYVISKEFLQDGVKKPRSALVEVSNLGTFNSTMPFEESYFAQTCSSFGASYVLNVIGSKLGLIGISLSTVEDDSEEIITSFLTRLHQLVA